MKGNMAYFIRANSMSNDRDEGGISIVTARKKAVARCKKGAKKVYIEKSVVNWNGRRLTEKLDVMGYVYQDGKFWIYRDYANRITRRIHEDGRPYPYR